MKRKGITDVSSEEKISKRKKTNSENGQSSFKKVETTALSKKLQKSNSGPVKTEEARSGKGKAEEKLKNSKPNGKKNQEGSKSNSTKGKKMEPKSPNPKLQSFSSRLKTQNKDGKQKTKTPEEQNKKGKQIVKTLKAQNQNGKLKTKTSKSGSEKRKQKTPTLAPSSPNGHSAKATGVDNKVGTPQKRIATPSKAAIPSAEKLKEPSGRRVKIMQYLGLVAPAGSPFHRSSGTSSGKT